MHRNLILSTSLGILLFIIEYYTPEGPISLAIYLSAYFAETPVHFIWARPLLEIASILELFPAWATGLLWGFVLYLVLRISDNFRSNKFRYLPAIILYLLITYFYLVGIL